MRINVTLRSERPEDIHDVASLLDERFPTSAEAELVADLRQAGRLAVSLVAEANSQIVGHIAFSPVSASGNAHGAGLGPVCVAEPHRRRGVGGELIRAGLEACRQAGYRWCVVLGEPEYYGRFGFEPGEHYGLEDEFGGGVAFQVLAIEPQSLPVGAGIVRYCIEFDRFKSPQADP